MHPREHEWGEAHGYQRQENHSFRRDFPFIQSREDDPAGEGAKRHDETNRQRRLSILPRHENIQVGRIDRKLGEERRLPQVNREHVQPAAPQNNCWDAGDHVHRGNQKELPPANLSLEQKDDQKGHKKDRLKFDGKGKRKSQHPLQGLFLQEEEQADNEKGCIERIHLTPLRAVDK